MTDLTPEQHAAFEKWWTCNAPPVPAVWILHMRNLSESAFLAGIHAAEQAAREKALREAASPAILRLLEENHD